MTNNIDDPKRPLEEPMPQPIELPPERNPDEPRPLTDPVRPQENQPRM